MILQLFFTATKVSYLVKSYIPSQKRLVMLLMYHQKKKNEMVAHSFENVEQ